MLILSDLGVRGASEGVSLPPCAQVSLLVVLVGPNLGNVEVETEH